MATEQEELQGLVEASERAITDLRNGGKFLTAGVVHSLREALAHFARRARAAEKRLAELGAGAGELPTEIPAEDVVTAPAEQSR